MIAAKYGQVIKSRGGIRKTLQKHGLLRVIDVGLREAWESFGTRILAMLGRRPGKQYGWLEALLSPACDVWLRYTIVMDALRDIGISEQLRFVEVASGGRGGIAWPMHKWDRQICLVDRSAELLRDKRGGKAARVCADACQLPFADESFDVAVSLDTVEHLPQTARAPFLKELKRISKIGVVITCPLQSADGEFQGRDFDLRLQREIADKNELQPTWLREHVEHGHPTRDELAEWLPGVKVTGSENCETWMRFARAYQRLFLWGMTGFLYLAVFRKSDTEPPYRRGLLVWRKPERVKISTMVKSAHANPCETTALVGEGAR